MEGWGEGCSGPLDVRQNQRRSCCPPLLDPSPELFSLWVIPLLVQNRRLGFQDATRFPSGLSPSSLWHHPCVGLGHAGCWTRLQPPAFLCAGFPISVCLLKLCIKPIFSTKEQSHIGCASRLLQTFYFWSVLLLFSWWEIKKVLLRLFWMPQKLQVAFCSEFQNFWVALCW